MIILGSVFLFLNSNICCGVCNEYRQHMIFYGGASNKLWRKLSQNYHQVLLNPFMPSGLFYHPLDRSISNISRCLISFHYYHVMWKLLNLMQTV